MLGLMRNRSFHGYLRRLTGERTALAFFGIEERFAAALLRGKLNRVFAGEAGRAHVFRGLLGCRHHAVF